MTEESAEPISKGVAGASYRLTILGCGSSGGVPRIGTLWGACDPSNPKNRRRRCGALVERVGAGGKTTRLLIDTPPDLRDQLLDAEIAWLDGVMFTHDHADHTHGIDDLRMVAYAMKRRIDCYFDAPTRASVVSRFSYCFETPPGGAYPPILIARDIAPGKTMRVEGAGGPIEMTAIPQLHGDIPSLGVRVGGLAYSPDISGLPDEALPLLRGLDVWVVDALRYLPHPSHFHLSRTLEWIERLAPKRAVLTHMTADLDYAALQQELPPHVEPAWDGMVLAFTGP